MNSTGRAINIDELLNIFPQNVNVDCFLGQIFSEVNGSYGYFNLHFIRSASDIKKSNKLKFQLRDLDLNRTPDFQLIPRVADMPDKQKLFKFLVGFIDNNNKWRAILRCVCCGLMIHYDSVQRNIQQGNARDEHLKNESVHFCTGKDPTKKCKDREALAKFAKTMNLIEVTPVLVSYSISPHQHKNQNPSEKVIKKRKADNTIIKVEEATKLCNVSYDFMRPKMNREGLEWLEEQRRLNLSILISFSLVNNMSSPDLSTHVTDTDSNSVSSPSSSTHYGSNYDALSETTHTSISIDQFLADTSDFYLPLQHNNNSIFNQPLSKNTRKNKMNESADSISLTEIKEEKLDSPVIKSEEDVGSSSSATPISIPVISFSSIDDIQNNVNNIHSNKDNQGETSNSSLTTPVFPFVKISRSASNTAESDHSHDNSLISIKRSSSLPSSYSEVIPDISNEVDLASELPPYVVDAPVLTAKENRISGKVISKDEELSKDSSSNIQFVKTKVNLEEDSELINITDGLKELKVGENEKQQQKKGEKGWKSVTDSLKNMFFSKESSKTSDTLTSQENLNAKFPIDLKLNRQSSLRSNELKRMDEKEEIKKRDEKEEIKKRDEKEELKEKEEIENLKIKKIKDYEEFNEKEILNVGAGESLSQMGKIFFNDQKYTEAVKIFEVASKLGSSSAQYHLGFCYFNGLGVEKDYNKAYNYFLEASICYPESSFYLGLLLYNGTGVQKNYGESFKHFKIAAESGNAYANCYLGQCCYYGNGTEKNFKEAFKYFNVSEEIKNNKDAEYYLARFFEKGIGGVNKDVRKARDYYQKSAKLGHSRANDHLGNLLVWENLNRF
ncbi:hypothetical protein HDU92_005090 [Lobulomyces angularis]|nr:hypothetical protein HDU92_005090 [Lobulomyces angularis]